MSIIIIHTSAVSLKFLSRLKATTVRLYSGCLSRSSVPATEITPVIGSMVKSSLPGPRSSKLIN